MGVSNRWPSWNFEQISHMEMRLHAYSCDQRLFFSSLTRLLQELSVSIRKKYPLEPRVTKSRQVPFFLYWPVENVQFCLNYIGHFGWLGSISNFPRFRKNMNSLELLRYISEKSSPKRSFWRNKRNSEFSDLRWILHIYRQWLLSIYENKIFSNA